MISGIKLMRIEPCFSALKPVYGENQQQSQEKNVKLPETTPAISNISIKQTYSDTFTSSVNEQAPKNDKKDMSAGEWNKEKTLRR